MTITVGGVDEWGKVPYYTENCAALLVTAYGGGSGRSISTTTIHHGFTAQHSGSSAAAPLVAGVLALVLEAKPGVSWRDVQHILVHSSRRTDPAHSSWSTNGANLTHSHVYGFGVVDADAAVTLAERWTGSGPLFLWFR